MTVVLALSFNKLPCVRSKKNDPLSLSSSAINFQLRKSLCWNLGGTPKQECCSWKVVMT